MKGLAMSIAAAAVVLAGAAASAQPIEVTPPSVTETEGLPHLPNVFKDCWEPLPAHCVRPSGLLWFGDAATLRHEHRVRARRVRAAVSR
jgi:hypothetical protein